MSPDEGTAPEPDLVGQVLAGRYRLLSLLGEGAMGAVYLGEHLRMGRRDAIKVLRRGTERDPEAMKRFIRGARNVSAVRHPNVCTIYDFGETEDGLQFLAMELVQGQTLKDVLDRDGRLPLERAVAIACQTAEALQAAHDAGIVHRDLKPGNIMLCPRPDGTEAVKVVDFDIAKGPAEVEGEEVTRMGFVVGTPEYMSPEQLIADRLDGRSDVYSLGIVLFRMLTGSLPFRAADTQEIMVQRLTVEPLRLEEVDPGPWPAALQQALIRSLARRREDRQPSAADFAREIAQAAGDEGAAAAGGPATARTAAAIPPTTRAPAHVSPSGGSGRLPAVSRRTAVIAAVVALLVVGGGSALFLRGDNAGEEGPAAPGDTTGAAVTQAATTAATEPPETDVAPSTEVSTARPGGSEVSPGTTGEGAADPPRTPSLSPAAIATILDRQMVRLNEAPSDRSLRAIRDTAELAWSAATSGADSAVAALVLAQAALMADDLRACAQWARRGSALDPAGFEMLLQVCR